MSIKIAPSILSADFGAFADAVVELSEAKADYIHIDVMDGHFVPVITFGSQLVSAIRPVTSTPFDVHLMIENAERFIPDFVKAGSNMVTVHPESTVHLHRLVHQIKDLGARPSVALNPSTPITAIEWVLSDIDRVLVMTVNPGFGGQAFIPEMLQKIRSLAECRAANGLRFEIAVDGGVNADTAPLVARAGADVLIAGSAVFHHPEGVGAAMDELRKGAAAVRA
ncbi:ribulose-phosphate 3-epimerase [Capsulimonas corticalis]|uniref:Ribulose-phosphate 3-epimerase n=1 Tax=Capsulimonas corticalis TaxID=2219043 RepID=A0A402CYR1_9BACT|nr:ribulose-phosphate 3-epimerase [Capsulimonas corticalis]BDI31260.1 ribulose-phosphate 3-epimerase [Capsulimonas corticalis]